MAVCGSKKSIQVHIRSDADVFYQLWTSNQEDVPSLTPANIQKNQIVRCGEVGPVGTFVTWNYTLEGEPKVDKTLIIDADEEKRSVRYKVLEGPLLEFYKTQYHIVSVKTVGSVNVVTWTIEYEKRNPYVPDPDVMLDFFGRITKDIDMGLSGEKVEKVKIKCDGDYFYQLWTSDQEVLPCLSPNNVQRTKVLGCDVGTVGTVVIFNFTLVGVEHVSQKLITDADEGKKSVTYKLLEGDLRLLYTIFIISLRVETDCSGTLVTWTIEYAKRYANAPDPNAIVDLLRSVTRDIDHAICGEKVVQVKIKSDSDFFFKLWTSHQVVIPCFTPTKIKKCQILVGELGTVGNVLLWKYLLDGKEQATKTKIIDKDEGKKSVSYKILEGDLLELYKAFVLIICIETDGSVNRVTCTIKYEKLNHKVPDPDVLLGDFCIKVIKDIEAHQLQN